MSTASKAVLQQKAHLMQTLLLLVLSLFVSKNISNFLKACGSEQGRMKRVEG